MTLWQGEKALGWGEANMARLLQVPRHPGPQQTDRDRLQHVGGALVRSSSTCSACLHWLPLCRLMPRMHRSCETIRGKIEEHARMGKPLLDGWAMGPDGSTVSETVV
jgi:hypothetical protein